MLLQLFQGFQFLAVVNSTLFQMCDNSLREKTAEWKVCEPWYSLASCPLECAHAFILCSKDNNITIVRSIYSTLFQTDILR